MMTLFSGAYMHHSASEAQTWMAEFLQTKFSNTCFSVYEWIFLNFLFSVRSPKNFENFKTRVKIAKIAYIHIYCEKRDFCPKTYRGTSLFKIRVKHKDKNTLWYSSMKVTMLLFQWVLCIFIQDNVFEDVVCKILLILFRYQRVQNWVYLVDNSSC